MKSAQELSAEILPPEPMDLVKFNNTREAKQLIAWVTEQYQKMKNSRKKKQREWYLNLTMYYGQQYYDLMPGPGGDMRLGVPKAPRHRVRTTVNKIRPAIRTEIARLTSQKPSCTVVPQTGEDEDMTAALAGEAVWNFISNQQYYTTRKAIRHAFWLSTCGTAFMKQWWDSSATDPMVKQEDPNTGVRSVAQGNVAIEPVSPFNIFVPDLLLPDIEQQSYVFEAYAKPVSWVRRSFPEVFKGKEIAPTVMARNEIFEASYFQVGAAAQGSEPDSCLFIEAWIKPGATDLLPEGGLVTICAGMIVQYTEGLPYEHKEFPYSKTVHIETGTFYGDSVINDLRPLQREYNRSRSQIIESRNRMSRPQLMVAQGSVDPSKFTSEPGAIIEYLQGFNPPQPLPLPQLPAFVSEDQMRILADMEDISGQHQVSKGMAPGGGVQAATAISFLQEKDDSIMYTAYASWEDSVTKTARQSLALVAQYWDMPRLVRVTGMDGAFNAYMFKGSDISNGMDIRCEAMSSLPQSKPARQAYLMDMAKSGFIEGSQLIDLLDIGGVQKLQERVRVDQAQAQRENLKMKMLASNPDLYMGYVREIQEGLATGGFGQQDPATGNMMFSEDPSTWPPYVPVNKYDNHAAHIQVHNNYRKGQEFESLPIEVKNQFESHVRLHEIGLMQQNQQAMMMGMGPQGPEQGGQQPQIGAPQE